MASSLVQGAQGVMQKSLPRRAYCSAEHFAAEKAALFNREWFCAGREEDVAQPDSAIVIEVLGESIIVARLADGSMRAHYNVCRHRGTKMCTSDEKDEAKWGLALNGGIDRGVIRCPYHQWAYGLDGALLSAPHLSRSPGFDKSEFALHPVGIGTWGGFYFVKLKPDAGDAISRDLSDMLGQAPRRLGNYPLASLTTGATRVYEVKANWKVIAENYNECYHCGGVHPELCEVVPALRTGGGLGLDWDEGIPHRDGAWTYSFSGTSPRPPFASLNAAERVRHKGELIYPNMLLSMSAEHGAAFFLWPIDTETTRVECRFLFDPVEIAAAGFDPADTVEFWDVTNRQDWAICERVQAGMASQSFEQGYFAPMEDDSVDIRRYLAKFIEI